MGGKLDNNYSDSEIITIIQKLKDGLGDDEEVDYWFSHQLSGLVGISDLIFYSDENMSAEEILKICRSQQRVISL